MLLCINGIFEEKLHNALRPSTLICLRRSIKTVNLRKSKNPYPTFTSFMSHLKHIEQLLRQRHKHNTFNVSIGSVFVDYELYGYRVTTQPSINMLFFFQLSLKQPLHNCLLLHIISPYEFQILFECFEVQLYTFTIFCGFSPHRDISHQ